MIIRLKSKSKFCRLYKSDIWGRIFISRKLTKFTKKWQPRQRTRITLGNFRGDLSKRSKFYRKRKTKYGKRLATKQKILKFYGPLKERHFISYLQTSRKAKRNIFPTLLEYLESRLDVVLFRSQLTKSIFDSRFNIIYNKIWINNIRNNRPKYKVNPRDIITLSNREYIKRQLRKTKFIWGFCPEYLSVNWKTLSINKYSKINLKNLNFPFKFKARRILEFYKV